MRNGMPEGQQANDENKVHLFMVKLLAGAIAGSVEGLIFSPIDRLKNRAVAEGRHPSEPHFSYLRRLTFGASVNASISSLWQGAFNYSLQKMGQKSIVFATANSVKEYAYPHTSPSLAGMIGGLAGGAAEVVFLQPVDVLKVRRQVNGQSLPMAASSIYTEAGLVGFYRAAVPTMIRNGIGTGAAFGADAFVAHQLAEHPGQRPTLTTDMLSTLAAVVARILPTQIPEVIKVRQQTGALPANASFNQNVKNLYKAEGMAGFTSGLGIRLFGSGFKFGVAFLGYKRAVTAIQDTMLKP